ncbi:MAG: substrate-binding domain-containing protein [Spirochaetaceae bacterium]|nr:substrate-binding domain-containing protein [Spirochaetaceae bacterium]
MIKKSLVVMFVLLLTVSTALVAGGQQDAADSGSNVAAQPLDVNVDGSAVILSTGPNGETATNAATLSLTADEVAQVQKMNASAAVVFHYAGNDWSSAQLAGLKATFASLNIDVVAVTDAQFKAEKQVADIETVMALSPDIIVSIPTDPVATSPAYKRAADSGVKIVFMDNVAANMTQGKDYVSVVSADNYGNGVAAADIMAEELGGSGDVGVIFLDADFFVTNQRVEAFKATIASTYPGINIVESSGFADPNKVSEVADAMLTLHPDIDGIFAVWDGPAEAVVGSAKVIGRDDLVITTIDLGNNAGRIIAEKGLIKGLGAQLPYDQGVSEAILAAYALLGKEAPPYVAVPALRVDHSNILEAFKQVYSMDAPAIVQNAYVD